MYVKFEHLLLYSMPEGSLVIQSLTKQEAINASRLLEGGLDAVTVAVVVTGKGVHGMDEADFEKEFKDRVIQLLAE